MSNQKKEDPQTSYGSKGFYWSIIIGTLLGNIIGEWLGALITNLLNGS